MEQCVIGHYMKRAKQEKSPCVKIKKKTETKKVNGTKEGVRDKESIDKDKKLQLVV